jgi:sporulation protein YabP
MAEEKKIITRHTVTLDRRESAAITGVLDVISFDEENVLAETDMGILVLRGNGLHVNRLNLDNGELSVDGEIFALSYEEHVAGKGKSNLLGRLFK